MSNVKTTIMKISNLHLYLYLYFYIYTISYFRVSQFNNCNKKFKIQNCVITDLPLNLPKPVRPIALIKNPPHPIRNIVNCLQFNHWNTFEFEIEMESVMEKENNLVNAIFHSTLYWALRSKTFPIWYMIQTT